MKKLRLLSAVIAALPVLLSAQTYQEVKENGWGLSMQICKPALADLDRDGLIDILVGTSNGNLIHFEQAVAGTDSVTLKSENFNSIGTDWPSAPCFSDIDHDGLIDLLIGTYYTNIKHYEQVSTGSLLFALRTNSLIPDLAISGLVPSITDLNNDGILDLIIGSTEGFLIYYKQDAYGSSTFSRMSTAFTGTDFGFEIAPCFTDIDGDGLLDLIAGENNGRFLHYRQTAGRDTLFTLVTEMFCDIDLGYMASAAFIDWDQDGLMDLVTGNSQGKLSRYEQDSTGSLSFSLQNGDLVGNIDVDAWAAPAIIDLDSDNLLDVCIGMDKARVYHYEQNTPGSTRLILVTDRWNDWDIGNFAKPVFTDLDKDDLIDLVIGEMDNRLLYFEQDAAGSTTFSRLSNNLDRLPVEQYPSPCFADIDHDGLLDLFVGNNLGTIQHFEQDRPNDTTFTLLSADFGGIDVGIYSSPVMTDLDNDGLLDLVVGCLGGNLYHYEQNAVNDTAFTLVTNRFADIQVIMLSIPTFADINRDGLTDLLVGDSDGGIHYYQRVRDVGIKSHNTPDSYSHSLMLFPNYPNPFNPVTHISYELPVAANVHIMIYNSLGQNVRVLTNNYQTAGSHVVQWDGTDDRGLSLASGTYTCLIRSGETRQSLRLLLLR